jgi:regulatory protein
MPRKKAALPLTAYRRAILRLARRDHSVAEMRRTLLAHGHDLVEVEEALARLRGEKYLDDAGYAERFARSRMAHAGLGRIRVRQALRLRGVSRGETEAGVRNASRELDEKSIVDRLARRYWKQHLSTEPARRLPRLWVFLLRRGFPPGLVRERLGVLWPRWIDALEGLEPLLQDCDVAGQRGAASERPGDEC